MTVPYEVFTHKGRVVIPAMLSILLLLPIFYLSLYFVLSLLEIDISLGINLLIGAIFFALFIIQFLVSIKKTKTPYSFESDGVLHGSKKAFYAQLGEITIKQDPIDKIFSTGTVITQMMQFKHIANPDQLAQYLQQWEQYVLSFQRGQR